MTTDMASGHGKMEVKAKIQNKSYSAISDLIALEKVVVRGSKSKNMIAQTAKTMAQQEPGLDHSIDSLQKMHIMLTHLHYQADSIYQSFSEVNLIQDQLGALKGGQ